MWTEQFMSQFSMLTIQQKQPLKEYTYTKTGGNAELLVFPETIEHVQHIVKFAHQYNVPLIILGNGSNIIVKDSGISGIVLMLEKLTQLTITNTSVVVGSGVKLIDLSRRVANENLTGLEFACGIPGSVGGAVYMNAGAYGGEMCQVIQGVSVVTKTGDLKYYTTDDMAFGYRQSIVQQTGDIVVETTISLQKGDKSAIEDKMAHLTQLRQSKQPLELPSCGSVFKRPQGYFAGKLIQDANLQGYRIGGVEVSKKHAGFMVNIDNGTASDYKKLIEHVQKEVYQQFGVTLEAEVRFIGD